MFSKILSPIVDFLILIRVKSLLKLLFMIQRICIWVLLCDVKVNLSGWSLNQLNFLLLGIWFCQFRLFRFRNYNLRFWNILVLILFVLNCVFFWDDVHDEFCRFSSAKKTFDWFSKVLGFAFFTFSYVNNLIFVFM